MPISPAHGHGAASTLLVFRQGRRCAYCKLIIAHSSVAIMWAVRYRGARGLVCSPSWSAPFQYERTPLVWAPAVSLLPGSSTAQSATGCARFPVASWMATSREASELQSDKRTRHLISKRQDHAGRSNWTLFVAVIPSSIRLEPITSGDNGWFLFLKRDARQWQHQRSSVPQNARQGGDRKFATSS